ncbi:MAG: glycosyltransferase [Deltaproteobacteria bacterium]|nr:glycosyltransferase [Deltaproteobacteria bacterium]
MPRVSVIAALYNHEKYVAEAIESVLKQTFTDWELILWDDGSTDTGLAIAQDYAKRHADRIRVFTHPGGANRGQENTRNAALEKATGEFISLLDTDDFYHPRKLELLVPRMANEEVGLAYGKAELVLEPGGRKIPSGIRHEPEGNVFDALVLENFICAGATLFRRSLVERGFRFDPTFKTCGEYPLWLEIARDWKFAHVPQVVAYWRSHATNLGTKLAVQAKAELVTLRERMAADARYAGHERALLAALAKSRYDHAAELYNALDLAGTRRETLRVLTDGAGGAGLMAKAAILYGVAGLGKNPNRVLSKLKRAIWESRHPLAAFSRRRKQNP